MNCYYLLPLMRILEAMSFCFVITYCLKPRFRGRIHIIVHSVFFISSVILRSLPLLLLEDRGNAIANWIGIILQFSWITVSCTGLLRTKFSLWMLYQLMLTFAEFFAILLGIRIYDTYVIGSLNSASYFFSLALCSIMVPFLALLTAIIWQRRFQNGRMTWNEVLLFLLFPLSMILMFFLSGQYSGMWSNPISLIGLVLFPFAESLLFLLIVRYNRRLELLKDRDIIDAALKQEQDFARQLLNAEDQLALLRHDYKNRLIILREVFRDQKQNTDISDSLTDVGLSYDRSTFFSNSNLPPSPQNETENQSESPALTPVLITVVLCSASSLLIAIAFCLDIGKICLRSCLIILVSLIQIISQGILLRLYFSKKAEWTDYRNQTMLLQKERQNNALLQASQTRFTELQKLLEDQFRNLEDLRRNGCFPSIETSLDTLEAQLSETSSDFYCIDPIINVILAEKLRAIRPLTDICTVSVHLSNAVRIAPIHLCSLFSNLLDNALESLADYTEGERIFRLSASLNNPYFVVRCENSSTAKHANRAKRDSHGLGTLILQKIADQYDGICNNSLSDGKYTVEIVLKQTAETSSAIPLWSFPTTSLDAKKL
ncbi:MAG: GHKL domain-containing protein [Lachnospiraceae bacterium]|nr:GHKL domain-containing protein [Lachnospiraceae bacterium]